MGEQPEINILLEEIRDSIKEYLDGDLPLPDARKRFASILSEYRSAHKKFFREDSDDYIRGLLYQHNVNNFAKCTAVFTIDKNNIKPLLHYGEKLLVQQISEKIKSMAEALPGRKTEKIHLRDEDGIPLYLYAYKLPSEQHTMIFSSITSSSYSNPDYFSFLCEFISKIIEIKNSENQCISFNFSSNLSQDIIDYIKENNDESGIVACIYLLKDLKKILNTIDISTMNKTSNYFTDTLRTQFPGESRIIMITHSMYLALCGKGAYENNIQKLNRITFVVGGLIIPFEMNYYSIDSAVYVYELIEEIYRLKQEFFSDLHAE